MGPDSNITEVMVTAADCVKVEMSAPASALPELILTKNKNHIVLTNEDGKVAAVASIKDVLHALHYGSQDRSGSSDRSRNLARLAAEKRLQEALNADPTMREFLDINN